ncbi:hypothetical protein EHF33_01170 [Deinococcus psychrotolerans]|uniref:Uncharacterized protein n=1 Tax=Deinococcus psychrotolerans TaxID=2489213 RepID=A0A3G8Y8N0_9DEIO|nr:hypothetical protein [Deinococcus psychrotolerans]AZI41535.1 hypothetical protein EHF33_01170 [Deinococcus psychrotolerans]
MSNKTELPREELELRRLLKLQDLGTPPLQLIRSFNSDSFRSPVSFLYVMIKLFKIGISGATELWACKGASDEEVTAVLNNHLKLSKAGD